MSAKQKKVIVNVTVQDNGTRTPTPNDSGKTSQPTTANPTPRKTEDEHQPNVEIITPNRISDTRPHLRSRSLGRSQKGDPWTQYARRSSSGRRGHTRVFAGDELAGTTSREVASLSRPLTPLNDGPPPVLPRPARSGEPDSTSLTSATSELASWLSLTEPSAPGADSHESLMRRFNPADTLIGRLPDQTAMIGRIPEQPETCRESLVAHLVNVNVFIVQPVYLSHRFQEHEGEKLVVLDQYGNPLLFAVETKRSAVRRACCCCFSGHRRPHQMMLYDLEERPVALFSRRLGCTSCWSPCCLQKAQLRDVIQTQEQQQTAASATCSLESEVLYGVIRQRWQRPWRRDVEFLCSGIRGGVELRVRGPKRRLCGARGGDAVFQILSMHGKARLGDARARWQPLDVQVFSRSDNYGVRFDRQLPSRAKVTLLGAVILLDFLYFGV